MYHPTYLPQQADPVLSGHPCHRRAPARFRAIAALVALLLSMLSCPRAGAALLVEEGFDYPLATTIAGQNGGTGWNGAWASGELAYALATNKPPVLSYTDTTSHTLLASGQSLVVGDPEGPAPDVAFPYRTLDNNLSGGTGTTPGAGRTVWLSFLYQRLNLEAGGQPYFRQANLGFAEGFNERLLVGGPNTSASVSNVFSVWSGIGSTHNASAPLQSAAHPLLPDSTMFVLIKVVTDGTAAADAAYIWVNPTNLTTEPNIATADLTDAEANLSGVNTLWFHAEMQNANGANAVFQVDEFRVGTTFDDVTPSIDYGAAPTILSDPEDLMVLAGQPASFEVAAVGTAPLVYQWYVQPNSPLAGGTNATYAIPEAATDDAGGYFVVITNAAGAATSAVALLTVEIPIPAQITGQPQNLTRPVGSPVQLSVAAIGTEPLHYQWYDNTDTLLPGKTSPTLSFTVTSTNDSGGYSIVVTNNYGAATSLVAQLTAVPAPPAFPGADGAARDISGGRGGAVYHVTKLDKNFDDAGPGTLKWCLSQPGPKTIVFDVAGVFWMGRYGAESNHNNGWDASQSRINWSGDTTIAGQAAPGPVILMGGVTKMGGVNTILRNVTIAAGYGMHDFHEPPAEPTPGDFPDSYVYDAIDISGQNLMVDHCTTLYTTDETISCNELADNLTIQYCTIAQGQNYPQADAERPGVYTGHALGSLLQAGSNAKVSVLTCLYAHLKGRLPRVGSEVGSGAINDFRNNVFYNWFGTAGTGSGGQPSFNNFINNFYLAGDGGDDVSGTNVVSSGGGTGIFSGQDSTLTRVYRDGNLKDTNKDADPNDTTDADGNFTSSSFQSAAYDVGIGVTLSAKAGFTNTLRHVGSRWWERDYDFTLDNTEAIDTNDIATAVDERLIRETATGTGKIVAWADDPFNNDPNEGVEWRMLLALRADPVTGAAPFNRPAGWDTDGDGMPDAWEIEHGLDPNSPNNNEDFDDDLYTDLEEYLNDLAAWPAPGTIYFTGEQDNRYAPIFNWRVSGVNVNISGVGNLPTSSLWQPSRYDKAVISNQSALVDAVGQHAGELSLVNNAALAITNGWLKVADRLENGSGCTATVRGPGSLTTSNLVNNGVLRLTGNAGLDVNGIFTNTGTLDIMTWEGTLPAGLINTGTILDRSLIVITDYGFDGNDFSATLEGYIGHDYQLQFQDDLTGGTWQNAGAAVAGTGAPIQFIHTDGATGSQRLFRVVVD